MLPLCLIIIISSLIFLEENSELHYRIDVFITCLVSALAYLIVCEDWLPKFHFWNYLNSSIMASTSILVYGAFISVLLFFLDEKGYKGAARKAADWMIV